MTGVYGVDFFEETQKFIFGKKTGELSADVRRYGEFSVTVCPCSAPADDHLPAFSASLINVLSLLHDNDIERGRLVRQFQRGEYPCRAGTDNNHISHR